MENKNTFLPDEYEIPASPSNYMKLQDGENTFRILSSAIIGYEYWTKDNKPVRNKIGWVDIPDDIKIGKDGKVSIKHFWAFVVWNYQTKQIQILELTQKTIQQAIKALVKNEKWGDPKGYDITVTRIGEGFDTEYSIMPNPHSQLDIEIDNAFVGKKINLNALYEGGDPFAI